MKIFTLTAMIALLATGGCSSEEAGSTANACDYIVGESYSSVDLLDCGAGRSPCRWQLYFEGDAYGNKTYTFNFQDQVVKKSFTCSGLSIRSSNQELGTYDVENDTILWSGSLYTNM